MFKLNDKTALVIGGAGGIGKACATTLAKRGADVVIADLRPESVRSAAEKIERESNGQVWSTSIDVRDEQSLLMARNEILNQHDSIDILVNAQGVNAKIAALDMRTKDWDEMFSVNARGVFLSCKVFGKVMSEQRQGKIVNISSVRGVRATDGGNTAYGATKGSVDMITRMLAAEWAPYCINVNAIGPSVVITENYLKAVSEERRAELLQKTLFKRFVKPEEVAAACLFLASAEADSITGQILYVDGGLTAVG